MRNFILVSLSIFISISSFATHERAGEITYKHVSGYTYDISVTTYTKGTSSPADRCTQIVFFGDGDSAIVCRSNFEPGDPSSDAWGANGCTGNPNCTTHHMGEWNIGNPTLYNTNTKKNVYTCTHIFPGAGSYKIYIVDPNHMNGIINLPDQTPIYLESLLVISSSFSPNNSVDFLNMPFDVSCIGKVFSQHHLATDMDGDSLAYSLVPCMEGPNQPIPGYFIPQGLTVDSVNGIFAWNSPQMLGPPYPLPYEYNFDLKVEEWHCRTLVGYVIREFQIKVFNCLNDPPNISSFSDISVLEGDTVKFSMSATDPGGNTITSFTATGKPFASIPPATFVSDAPKTPTSTGTFSWMPTCTDVQKDPHRVLFRTTDDGAPDIPPIVLSDYKTVRITVIGKPVQSFSATPWYGSINLNWTPVTCSSVVGYNIYNMPKVADGPCDSAFSHYTFLSFVPGASTNSYTDYPGGHKWCYMVAPVYGTECSRAVGIGIPTDSTVSILLGTNDLHSKFSLFSFSPNPSSDEIRFDFGSCDKFPLSFDLYDYSGRKIASSLISQRSLLLDIRPFSEGLYFFRLKDSQNNFAYGKFERIR